MNNDVMKTRTLYNENEKQKYDGSECVIICSNEPLHVSHDQMHMTLLNRVSSI